MIDRHSWSAEACDVAALQRWIREHACERVMEIGTNNGYSAAGIIEVMPPWGIFCSCDVDNSRVDPAVFSLERPNFRFFHGSFRDVGPDMLAALGWVDLLFDDGSHEYQDVLDAIELVVPHLSPKGVIFVHDAVAPGYPTIHDVQIACMVAVGNHRFTLRPAGGSMAILCRE